MSMTPHELVAEAQAQIKAVDLNSAAQHVAAGGLIIDVREPGEFDAGRLPGAINLPRGVLEFKIGDNPTLTNKDTSILLYCKTGGRAALAALNLQRMGYAHVQSMTGGYDAWIAAGQKTVTDTTQYN